MRRCTDALIEAAWLRQDDNRLDERSRRYELIDPEDRLGGPYYETGQEPVKEGDK